MNNTEEVAQTYWKISSAWETSSEPRMKVGEALNELGFAWNKANFNSRLEIRVDRLLNDIVECNMQRSKNDSTG